MIDENEYESSFEKMDGEEEDEDDLLKSESETNKSSNKEQPLKESNIINESINANNIKNEQDNQNNNNCDNKENEIANNNGKNTENNRTSIVKDIEPDNLNESFDLTEKSMKKEKNEENSKISNESKEIEEKNKSEDIEDEDEDDNDDEEEEESEESINPYEKYLDSKISNNKNYLHQVNIGDYLYETKNKIYYKIVKEIPFKKNSYIIIKAHNGDENLQNKILKDINDFGYHRIDQEKNEETKKQIKTNINNYIKNLKKTKLIEFINDRNINEFTINRKIKIYYLNYLNKKITFEIPVNINCKFINFIDYLKKIYHFPNLTNNTNLTIIIKNKKYSGKKIEDNKNKNFFYPNIFDYEKDYIIILEHENFEIVNIDIGSYSDKFNFKGNKIPHLIFSSQNNFSIDSILVSKQLRFFECDIYVYKDSINFNIERNMGKYNFKKVKQALSSFNLENNYNYVASIKSVKYSDYSDNENVVSFSIWPKFNLYHHKSYVFLVYSPIKNINAFDSGSAGQGLFIISSDNKCIINGIVCKKFSDFI